MHLAHFFSRARLIRAALLTLFALCCGVAIVTGASFHSLLRGDVPAAVRWSSIALPFARASNIVTAHKIPDILLWETALELPSQLYELQLDLSPSGAYPLGVSTSSILEHTTALLATARESEQHLSESRIVKHFLPQKYAAMLEQYAPQLSLLEAAAAHFQQGTQRWIVLLQNSDELRATGGFIGSYASIQLQNGEVTEFVIEDVYDADGQFQGFVPAPPGVAEYLSSGNGLRLPDANWNPDFPTSAQTVLQFFALGERQGVSGVVAINHTLIARALSIVGPVYLPDYDTSLSAETLSTVLRDARGEFFPGSIQKKHLLSHAFTQLKLAASTLTADQYRELLALALSELRTKQIQAYATNPELQREFESLDVAGAAGVSSSARAQLNCTEFCELLTVFPVESNVGINKANSGVTRVHSLELSATQATLNTQFTNSNSAPSPSESARAASASAAPHNGYVNYQRVLLPPDVQLQKLSVNGAPVTEWSELRIPTSTGQELLQLGFLVTVPEASASTYELTFDLPARLRAAAATEGELPVLLAKQSGVPPTPTSIRAAGTTHHILLEEDTLIRVPLPRAQVQ